MPAPIYCHGCGQRVEVPEGYTRTKLRCAECGVFNELPKGEKPGRTLESDADIALKEEPAPPRKEKPKPKPKPKSEPETFAVREEPTPPANQSERDVLIQGTEDDDGNPYQVTGDVASKRCPECDRKLEKKAAACTNCGFDFSTKAKKERTFQPIDKEWEVGYPFQTRLSIFFAMQAVNLFMLVFSVVANQSLGMSIPMLVLTVFLQAFLVGTYARLNLTRTQKGKVTITTTWRYAFIARPTETVKWKEHDSITVTRENEFDFISWVFVFILLGYACLPGIAFWYFVVRPDKFTVALCKDHGYPETPLFRTTNEERAKEVMKVVSEVSTLPERK